MLNLFGLHIFSAKEIEGRHIFTDKELEERTRIWMQTGFRLGHVDGYERAARELGGLVPFTWPQPDILDQAEQIQRGRGGY